MRAIIARMIAAGFECNMASQFRFGYSSNSNKINNSPAQTILPHPVCTG
jgi:hypothetical protein